MYNFLKRIKLIYNFIYFKLQQPQQTLLTQVSLVLLFGLHPQTQIMQECKFVNLGILICKMN